MVEIDPRLLKLAIEVNGEIREYTDLFISAQGTKYANATMNEATIKITNLKRSVRDFILTESSPFNRLRVRKKVALYAGRQSYGYFKLFEGDIMTSSLSEPPDIEITLSCKTAAFSNTQLVSNAQPALAPLSKIAKSVADNMGLTLQFEAKDKQISNYSFSGAAGKQVERLGDAGGVSAFVDDNVLIVKDSEKPVSNVTHELSLESGMIGKPELNDQGLTVKYLLGPGTRLGGSLTLKSKTNPAANGTYQIYQLAFDVANRDTPFYWIASAKPGWMIF